MLIDR